MVRHWKLLLTSAAIPAIVFGCGKLDVGPGGLASGILPTSLTPSTDPSSTPSAAPVAATGPSGFVLGQNSFTTSQNLQEGLSTPYSPATDGTHLAIADYNNNRVLIWNFFPTSNLTMPDVVLGQPNLNSAATPTAYSRTNMTSPRSVAISNGKMAVCDQNANRILFWNSIPTSNQAPPDFVLGAANFTNPGGYYCEQVALDSTNLYVANPSVNQVTVFTLPITSNGQAPNFCLGQVDCNGTTANQGGAAGQNTLSGPVGVYSNGSKLFVSDKGNNRVLVFSPLPNASNANAANVIGQPDFTSTTANGGGAPNSTHLKLPGHVGGTGSILYVSDGGNYRTLRYDFSGGLSNGMAANLVLGASSLSGLGGSCAANGIGFPTGVTDDGAGHVIVTDSTCNRALIWNTALSTNGQAANVVLGQEKMTDSFSNYGGSTASTMNLPEGVYSDGTRILVSDNQFNRITGWNLSSVSNGQAASLVLGQPDLVSNAANNGGRSASTLVRPQAIAGDGTRLLAVDSYNNRVLIWSHFSSSPSTAAADLVLGEPDMTSSSSGTSSTTMNLPLGVATDGTNIAVSEWGNNRVLLWTHSITSNGQAADLVLGQPDMTTSTFNTGGIGPRTMMRPNSVAFCGSRLVVSDTGNNRVLVWNQIPTTTMQPADAVLGQPDTVSSSTVAASNASFNVPQGIYCTSTRLFVADKVNNRIMVWNSFPVTTGQAADQVIGQADFTSSLANRGGSMTSTTLNNPVALGGDAYRLFIVDQGNARVLSMLLP